MCLKCWVTWGGRASTVEEGGMIDVVDPGGFEVEVW